MAFRSTENQTRNAIELKKQQLRCLETDIPNSAGVISVLHEKRQKKVTRLQKSTFVAICNPSMICKCITSICLSVDVLEIP
ncbi:uncharacterized protein G2W53_020350 [Senna tora]|uniref:Uncharacterized protein n=1 Tax=Senna tora TaxID=362788 RepID=A0A834TYV9_9FABA|nr:uncharacterized protein G2W53_020350 [Senna tora]